MIEDDKKRLENHFNRRIEQIEEENELLEIQLKNKNQEISKLDKQFRDKRVKTYV